MICPREPPLFPHGNSACLVGVKLLAFTLGWYKPSHLGHQVYTLKFLQIKVIDTLLTRYEQASMYTVFFWKAGLECCRLVH